MTCRFARKFFVLEGVYLQNGNVAVDFIEKTNPDFVFVDFISQTANDSLQEILNNFESNHRFRVHLFYLSLFKTILFKLIPFQIVDVLIENFINRQTAK
ncbi:MAG TPA: hypothetical protein PKA80_05970 [Ignavibacteriaceae bacterium]|nr:hypothetical protein [Ignavibacteriaceae bacterium]